VTESTAQYQLSPESVLSLVLPITIEWAEFDEPLNQNSQVKLVPMFPVLAVLLTMNELL
jgi:hypothetical protein